MFFIGICSMNNHWYLARVLEQEQIPVSIKFQIINYEML